MINTFVTRLFGSIYYPCEIAHESRDCGPACLVTLVRKYGHNVSIGRCRSLLRTDLQGTSLKRLADGAVELGFKAVAGKTSWERLIELPTPFIVHTTEVESGHFIVIHKILRHKFYS